VNGVVGYLIGVVVGLLGWISFNLMNAVFLLRQIRDTLERKP
jgi:hypothetical protein